MLTRSLRVERTARVQLSRAPERGLREVWFLLHGYAQTAAEFLEQAAALDGPARLLVAPEGLSRFYRRGGGGAVGASWMTREAREAEIDDYLRYLDRLHEELASEVAPDASMAVLGFSQGAATASRWSALGRARLERVVLWGGLPAPELEPEAWRARLGPGELVLVHGRGDALVDAQALGEAAERLERAGLRLRRIDFDGGHGLDAGTLRALGGG